MLRIFKKIDQTQTLQSKPNCSNEKSSRNLGVLLVCNQKIKSGYGMHNLATKEDDILEYLRYLNPQQLLAVQELDRHLLVLAGAGTGKTRVLTTRIAHILRRQRARPHEIMALTFTNKAAAEMKERVNTLFDHRIDLFWMGTFHSVSAKILRQNAEILGYSSTFTILDSDDQLRLIKQILKEENVVEGLTPNLISIFISRWKDRGWLPDQVKQAYDSKEQDALKIYHIYQSRLKNFNSLDFGDLLLLSVKLFLDHPDVLAKYHQQFKYILVDEYQDTNIAQYLWLKLLAQGGANICCVGDDDQSIYGWRGAEVANILRFEEDFKNAFVVRLEQNYRSTPEILEAASHLIAQNKNRFGKKLWTEAEAGEKISVRGLWDSRDEARYVGEEIETLQRREKLSLNKMAVLIRAGYQTREFEERFIILGIPYRVVGGPRFYERMEIRDALAYMRVIVEPNDSMAYERILNTPKRGIGTATLQLLHLYAKNQETSLFEATKALVETEEIRGSARKTLQGFIGQILNWQESLSNTDHHVVASGVLEESGYFDMWERDRSPEASGRIENLKEMLKAIQSFENLQAFLEHVSLVMENASNRESEMVTLMTLHSAKGLEFDSVFLAGWDEGIFPHNKALQESGDKGLEEERRLAYVGLTRAKRKVFITYASYRRFFGGTEPSFASRFIEELPPALLDRFTDRGITGKPLEKPIFKPVSSNYSFAGFQKGERVFHIKFGYGKIISIENDKAEVAFESSGTKKVVSSFLKKV